MRMSDISLYVSWLKRARKRVGLSRQDALFHVHPLTIFVRTASGLHTSYSFLYFLCTYKRVNPHVLTEFIRL